MEELKIKYIQTHATGGDCTAPYDLEFNRECTLKEFIDFIITRGSFGDITINTPKIFYALEFKPNKITKGSLESDLLNNIVTKANCAGGWGRMDYRIWVK